MKSLFAQALPLAATLFLSTANAQDDTKYLLVFGDSYSTVGYWPGGEAPSASSPLGSVALPGSTTSGGYNWVGQATAKLNTTLTLTYDFAVSGATTDKDIVDSYASSCVDDQVDQFGQYVNGTIPAADALAVFWTGINDVGESFWDGVDTPIEKVMVRYGELLETLFDEGLRKFVVFTVPPFDNAPAFANQDATKVQQMRSDISAYNTALTERFASFKAANSGATGQVFNTTPSFEKVLNDPSSYGISDTTCQNGDGVTCMWTDTYHPGQAVHELLAKAFMEEVADLF